MGELRKNLMFVSIQCTLKKSIEIRQVLLKSFLPNKYKRTAYLASVPELARDGTPGSFWTTGPCTIDCSAGQHKIRCRQLTFNIITKSLWAIKKALAGSSSVHERPAGVASAAPLFYTEYPWVVYWKTRQVRLEQSPLVNLSSFMIRRGK